MSTTLAATAGNSSEETVLPPSARAPERDFLGRFQHLGLVLWVGLSMPITSSVYVLLRGTAPTALGQQQMRLVGGLITEATSLLVLWYVMCRQGKTWKDIGWTLELGDVPRAFGLLVGASLVTYALLLPVQFAYRAYSGHFLSPKPLNSVFGFGITALSFTFICLNPFFEELIVRAYTISEVVALTGSRVLAVVFSVVAQMSYHLYQGLASGLALTFLFTLFSIYYVRTRKIVPVILAHLCLDLLSLLRGTF